MVTNCEHEDGAGIHACVFSLPRLRRELRICQTELPFGFSVSIGEIENSFNISQNGSSIAGLTTPIGSSTSNIKVLSSTDTEGTIDITIDNVGLSVPGEQHTLFSQFSQ